MSQPNRKNQPSTSASSPKHPGSPTTRSNTPSNRIPVLSFITAIALFSFGIATRGPALIIYPILGFISYFAANLAKIKEDVDTFGNLLLRQKEINAKHDLRLDILLDKLNTLEALCDLGLANSVGKEPEEPEFPQEKNGNAMAFAYFEKKLDEVIEASMKALEKVDQHLAKQDNSLKISTAPDETEPSTHANGNDEVPEAFLEKASHRFEAIVNGMTDRILSAINEEYVTTVLQKHNQTIVNEVVGTHLLVLRAEYDALQNHWAMADEKAEKMLKTVCQGYKDLGKSQAVAQERVEKILTAVKMAHEESDKKTVEQFEKQEALFRSLGLSAALGKMVPSSKTNENKTPIFTTPLPENSKPVAAKTKPAPVGPFGGTAYEQFKFAAQSWW